VEKGHFEGRLEGGNCEWMTYEIWCCFTRRTRNITDCNVGKNGHFEGRNRIRILSEVLTGFAENSGEVLEISLGQITSCAYQERPQNSLHPAPACAGDT
jgi:hypothetical protein